MTDITRADNANNEKVQLLGLFEHEIAALIPSAPKYAASQILSFLHDGKSFDEMTSLSKALRAELAEKYVDNPVTIAEEFKGRDGTKKYLFALPDGNIVEGVFMPHDYGNTLCLSTQVGCRMGCVFCASGIGGLVRNLTAAEMLGQVIAVNRSEGGTAKNRAVTNLVLMGSGEPFDNYTNFIRFLDLLGIERGINISERNISVSSSGLADKIKEFADSGHKVTLSISLHTPFDEKRSALMPINRKHNIASVMSAARYYCNATGRRVIIEYTLIDGENDTEECAKALSALTRGFQCHVNLIRLNEIKENKLKKPSADKAKKFLEMLTALGTSATIRRSMGNDIEGACGQLRAKYVGENTPASSAKKKD